MINLENKEKRSQNVTKMVTNFSQSDVYYKNITYINVSIKQPTLNVNGLCKLPNICIK